MVYHSTDAVIHKMIPNLNLILLALLVFLKKKNWKEKWLDMDDIYTMSFPVSKKRGALPIISLRSSSSINSCCYYLSPPVGSVFASILLLNSWIIQIIRWMGHCCNPVGWWVTGTVTTVAQMHASCLCTIPAGLNHGWLWFLLAASCLETNFSNPALSNSLLLQPRRKIN